MTVFNQQKDVSDIFAADLTSYHPHRRLEAAADVQAQLSKGERAAQICFVQALISLVVSLIMNLLYFTIEKGNFIKTFVLPVLQLIVVLGLVPFP